MSASTSAGWSSRDNERVVMVCGTRGGANRSSLIQLRDLPSGMTIVSQFRASSTTTSTGDSGGKTPVIDSLACIGSRGLNQSANGGELGDYIIAATSILSSSSKKKKKSSESSTTTFMIWRYGREVPEATYTAPEHISTLVGTRNGEFLCAGSSPTGNLYIWETATGKLIRVCKAHYRSITCLAVSLDGAFIFTGSDDGLVHVWRLAELVSFAKESGIANKPVCTLSGHTLSISGICCSGAFHVITSSHDHTCKIWNIASSRLVASLSFSSTVSCSTVTDSMGRELFVGTGDGSIHIVSLWNELSIPPIESARKKERLGGGHSGAVTYLSYNGPSSSYSSFLFSGAEDGSVCMWNVENRQLVKTIVTSSDGLGPIRYLACLPRIVLEEQYIFRATLSHSSDNHHQHQPMRINPLKRYAESKDDEEFSRKAYLAEVFPTSNFIRSLMSSSTSPKRQRRKHQASKEQDAILGTNLPRELPTISSTSTMRESITNEELEEMRRRIHRLEAVNSRLFALLGDDE
jgi:hypothetical protein